MYERKKKDITRKINDKEEEVKSLGRDISTLAPSTSPSDHSGASLQKLNNIKDHTEPSRGGMEGERWSDNSPISDRLTRRNIRLYI